MGMFEFYDLNLMVKESDLDLLCTILLFYKS